MLAHKGIEIIDQVSSGGTTEVIAVVGVALSVLSLGWQAVQYKLGGPSLKNEILSGYTNGVTLVSGPVGSG